MSHLRERTEKNCLNCNAQVAGKYCQICGQENIEVKESTWHLITHFFNDITHFDGKFFSTLKYLVFKPGFVSTEYIKGRRQSYLNPVRMYVFTSAIFFLIFFSLYHFTESSIGVNQSINKHPMTEIAKMDSAHFAAFTTELNNGKPMTWKEFDHYVDTLRSGKGFHFTGRVYKSSAEYDSLLANGVKKHNWLQRTMIHREIELNEKYKNDQAKILAAFASTLIHSIPQMLFVSLPLFALILQLLYARRKEFYYTNHLIFSIHFYIAIFIMLLFIIGLQQLKTYIHWNGLNWIIGFIYAFLFYYEYRSMRNFYQQGRGKTILKFILLNILYIIIITILFLLFTFFSFLKI